MEKQRPRRNLQLGVRLAVLLMAGTILNSTGCTSSSVNMFASSDYYVTSPNAVIEDNGDKFVCVTNGIWLSRPAVERLQRHRALSGAFRGE